MTLIEVLVAAMMRGHRRRARRLDDDQRAQGPAPNEQEARRTISNARWVMERLTREIRNGCVVDKATPSSVSFRTYVRTPPAGAPGRRREHPGNQMQVDLHLHARPPARGSRRRKASSRARRRRSSPGSTAAASSATCRAREPSLSNCGRPSRPLDDYIGVKLPMPSAAGQAPSTISDGASMRNATLTN